MLFVEAIKYAAKGSVAKANAWASVAGAVVLWLGLYLMGFNPALPTTWLQAIFTFLACLGTAWVLIFFAKLFYWPYRELMVARSKGKKSPLEITWEVQVREKLYVKREYYSLGIVNNGETTLKDVTVRALHSWFTDSIIVQSQFEPEITASKAVPLLSFQSLHPKAPEHRELFGMGYKEQVSNPLYILNTVQRFVIEAIAQDVPAVRQTFEYDRNARPMIRPISD